MTVQCELCYWQEILEIYLEVLFPGETISERAKKKKLLYDLWRPSPVPVRQLPTLVCAFFLCPPLCCLKVNHLSAFRCKSAYASRAEYLPGATGL